MYVHFKIWCTTKEAFIVDSMKIIFAKWQLYTWQYVQFAKNAMAHYKSAKWLLLKSISESFSESEGESNELDIPFLN